MSSSQKGKAVADKDGKRKRDYDDDKTGRKGKNRSVIQFFDDEAGDGYDSSEEDSVFGNGYLEDLFGSDTEANAEPEKATFVPFVPKEEEMTEEDFDKMMEERYKSGSGAVRYADDNDHKKQRPVPVHMDFSFPSGKDPIIWKLKCAIGRERHSVFCLMQKYVELHALGTKLRIISAISLDHVKGYIFVEAEKQADVNEACKGICNIYLSRTTKIAANEMSQLLSTRNKLNVISEGTWARVKSGTYKGDLTQIVAVNDARKRATVKLIPRLDLQQLALKYGGGGATKKTTIPPPRLIGLAELEEFRPLIQFRRDRDTDLTFQILDGLMLKDGYIYKKVPLDSLNFSGVNPSEDEILKFNSSEKCESNDLEWLSQLYGGRDKKRPVKSLKRSDKGGEKGEGSSSSFGLPNGYEIHDLVCFGRKDFGIILGFEKDNCKILKDAPDGSVVVAVDPHQLTTALSDTKFTALDQKKKTLSPGDTVKVMEGPSQGRQGIVKHIYRGVIFLTDDNEENDGYFCAKSFMCEKVKLAVDTFQPDEGAASGFADFPSSPKSHMPEERNRDYGREDKDGMFSVGQTLRIRVGPLKGYLCRVLAIRYSDITVKLNSQTKIYTVKSEHLSEVRKMSTIAASDDIDSKPDALGNLDSGGDWMTSAGTSTENNGWNVGAATEGSGWSSLPVAAVTSEQIRENNSSSWDNPPKNDGGGWESGTNTVQNSSWGGWGQKKPEDGEASEFIVAQVPEPLQNAAGWENKKTTNQSSDWGGWGQKKPENNESGGAKALGSTWGKDAGPSADTQTGGSTSWEYKTSGNQNSAGGGWGNKTDETGGQNDVTTPGLLFEKAARSSEDGDSCWGNKKSTSHSSTSSAWGQKKEDNSVKSNAASGPWGKTAEIPINSSKGADCEANWENKKYTDQKSWGAWGEKKYAVGETDSGKASVTDDKMKSSLDAFGAGNNWNTPKASGEESSWNKEALKQDSASAWGKKKDVIETPSRAWGTEKSTSQDAPSWNKPSAGKMVDESFNDSKIKGEVDAPSGANSWNTPKAFGGESSWNKETEKQDSTSAWGKRKEAIENPSSGWGAGKSIGQGAPSWGGGGATEQTDSWKKPKISFNDEGASWNKQGADSSWVRQGGQDTKSFEGESGGRWGRGRGRDQRGGRSFGGGSSAEWSKDSEDFSGNGSRGGRGGFDSGGYRGRGRSEGGGFRGRGRSEGGGFRGRGSFDHSGSRGGFGGRGGFGERGRDSDRSGGGWNDGNSFTQKSWGTDTSSNNRSGWSNEQGIVATGDSQSGKSSEWKSRGSGGGTAEGSTPIGWSQGASWNSACRSNETEGNNTQAGNWGKNDETGGWNASSTKNGGWSSETAKGSAESSMAASATVNQSTGWGGGGSEWNSGAGKNEDGGSSAQTGKGGWN